MSVHQERDEDGTVVWKVRWRQGGRQRARRFNPKTLGGKAAARNAAQAFDAQMHLSAALGDVGLVQRGRLPFREYAERWWERYARVHLAESTLPVYATQIDLRLVPKFGEWELREITPGVLEEWIGELRAQGVGEPTILKTLTVLQSICNRAVVDEELDRNPVDHIKKPRQRRARDPKPIEPMYVERMRAHLLAKDRPADALLICLLAYAGLRPESEAITLQWPQIRKRTILVRASKQHGKERTVRILAPLAEDITAYRASTGALQLVGPVFPREQGWTGDDWDNWRERVFRPAAVAAGLPADVTRVRRRRNTAGKPVEKEYATTSVRPRDLRGSLASLLIWEGQSIVDVARQLGHSAETCLRDYASVFEEFDPAARRPAVDVIREARESASVFPLSSRSASKGATS